VRISDVVCGSLLIAAAVLVLVIVLVGEPYCTAVTLDTVSLIPESDQVALVVPPDTV
jgi:hypothetical protein